MANVLRFRGSFWKDIKTGRWIVQPSSSFRLLLLPVVFHLSWIFLTPFITTELPLSPFAPLLFISHPTPSPTDDATDPRYRKGWLDLLFIAYYVVFWSFVRQTIIIHVCRPLARRFRVKKSKRDRFEYPHWQMIPELKTYYLVQAAYWCQQLIVMVMGLEKPRKDYSALVAHHIVTLWLIGWSYSINLTLIGNAVYASMDIPDTFLSMSLLLNYLRMERAKVAVFLILLCTWTYFRHYLNLVMLWSVYKEFDMMPESSKRWAPSEGVWMVWWMKWQIFVPILLLQALNVFWYSLILRIAYRFVISLYFTCAVTGTKVRDDRSDDED
ncbi:longevity assurance proteins LAG1/LAC1 [Vararia minispora EC-137]|uniref:Longevity assurance proteins LAG1/LAC1 n=1 Tax=Vararia minispora EC-137 TaxID=1314806 RepID=A0ACB8QJL4_9AGAM|nr:longevity assurance proteins LAG1/LAC1 [Vararia minispora EC-137]